MKIDYDSMKMGKKYPIKIQLELLNREKSAKKNVNRQNHKYIWYRKKKSKRACGSENADF